MNTNLTLKRIGAYFIDYLIITLVSTALVQLSFINPKYEEYIAASEEYQTIVDDYYNQDITANELSEKTNEISYELNKNGYVYIIGDIVIAFLYFGVFAYFTKGQTLGKKIFGIKIVRAKNDTELKLSNYFIRTFILNGIILDIIILIAICFKESIYSKIYLMGSNFDTILLIVIFLMILFYKEGRGLHDILAGTKVIDLKKSETPINQEKQLVKEEQEVSEINDEVQVIKPKKGKKKDE